MTSKPRVSAAIVVVEDDPQQMELLNLAIADLPIEIPVMAAADGAEAVRRINECSAGDFRSRVALVLLDLRLPRVHGLDVLAHAGQLGLTAQVPFVVLTTSDSVHERNRSCELGARDYLVKPLGFRALQALVMGLYERWLVGHLPA